ncbi:hypothetical protein SAMN04488058_1154 [Deinococcus reticulitermitis]|uniref:DUF927 domain-containing protein n=2 Tax=Deinococcus reticulitermitis TaxID=856736 RepID=A0A1H7AZN5_9DEIO|nr:hypothetical protein SAMN04488058_1154 [Deinococcus reticulitermitis]
MTGAGDALRSAYGAPANAPAELLRLAFPGCEPRPAGDGSGVMCDPRGGQHAERTPSFTFWRGEQDGGAMFQRKGTGETWNALQLLEQFGNGGAGMTRADAAALLISRAGLERQDAEQGSSFRPGVRMGPPSLGKRLRERQGQAVPVDAHKALAGWEALKRWHAGEDDPGPAWKALEARGLLPALALGFLEAFRRDPRKAGRLSSLLTPEALAFKVRGPEAGTVAAVKYRNNGSAEQLGAAGLDRYVYAKGHKGTPAHTSPGLTAPGISAEVWTEGELNGVGFMLALGAAGLSGSVGVQGMAGATGNPHVLHDLTGRRVFIYADPDKAGEEARTRWARLALEVGAVPYMLPPFIPGDPSADAADFLGRLWDPGTPEGERAGAEALGEWLSAHMRDAEAWQDPEPGAEYGEGFQSWPYKIEGGQVGKLKRSPDGPEDAHEFRPLLGFTARIVAEVSRDSGDGNPLRVFQIEGRTPEGRPLPPVEVPTGKFSAMSWPLEHWGADGFVYPGSSVKDEARAALLSLSRAAGMDRRTVYTHTGWVQLPEHGPVFLTAGACIGSAGAVPGVGVSLLGKLKHYALPDPPEGDTEREAVRSALELLELGPPSLLFPLLGGVFRAPLGNVRFSEWLESRTGWGKSTLAAVLQSFYGAAWIEHFPPADFQSTDNALTLGAFLARDVLFVADDFKPEGSRSDVDRAHAALSRFLSSAGNGAGRDRMTADALTVRQGYYPRGLVLATAEQGPRKHSDVARTVALTVPGPLFGPGGPADGSARFDEARRNAEGGTYARAMAGFLRYVAAHFPAVTGAALAERVALSARDFPGTHGRTAQNAAELLEGWRVFLSYARDCGTVTEAEALSLGKQAAEALRDTSAGQATALEQVDPVTRFLPLLSGLLRSGAAFLRDAETGDAPGANLGADSPDAPAAGWRWRSYGDPAEGKGTWETRPGAVPVGFLGEYGGQTYALLEASAYAQVNRAAEGEGHGLPAPRSLWQGLRDRHAPSGDMVAESGKATYRRSVYGCGPKGRIPFYNFLWPLSPQKRDERDTEQETPSHTGKSGVPFYLLEKGQSYRKGTPLPDSPSHMAFSGVPFLPSAETAVPDAQTPEEADGLEVFTV